MRWDDQRLGRHLKLRDLHVLMTVAQCRSMGKAAAQLSVSQPAISKAIAEMEYALGVRLLDRSPQGVQPTIYAQALLDRSLVAFDELRQGVKHIEFLSDPMAGELRIGASIHLASGLVPAIIDRLSRRRPRIAFHLVAGEAEAMHRALTERKLDLLVARIFGPFPFEQMDVQSLYDEPHFVVAAASNPWTRRRKVTLVDLIDEPWTLPPPDTVYGEIFREPFRRAGLEPPRTTVFTYTNPARRALVTGGRFLTIVPESILTFPADSRELKRLPIDLPSTRTPIAIVTLKQRTLSPVAQLFIDCAREVAKPLANTR